MIAATVFVVVFIVIGLGTVLVAMNSRRGPSRPPSRAMRRATVIVLPIVIVLLGIGVPAVVIAYNHNDHADVGPGGLALSHNTNSNIDELAGRTVFAAKCATCHTLHGANAVGKVGPNLDLLIGGLAPSTPAGAKLKRAFILNAISQGRARGAGQMPAQLVVGRQAQDVAAFVAAVAGH